MNHRDAARLLLFLLGGVLMGWTLAQYTPPLREAPLPAAVAAVIAPQPKNDKPESKPSPEPPADDAAAADFARLKEYLAGWLPADAEPAGADEPDYSPEVVMYDQPRLLDEALAKLKRHTPGKADLYLLAFGGDGDEDVFRNEVEYAESLFSQRFGAKGRTLVLENNPATVGTRPLATWTNLETALDRLSTSIMDPDEDILVLFMTSHGSRDHELYVGMGNLPLDQIGAEDLADILAAHPMRWKVVIVSACYSGGFVAPLKNATTMVITAARADRTSFGCGADSDITYFGKAFLAEGLNESDTFRGAFDIAVRRVAEWESTHEEGEPSEPQFAATPLIEAKLASWRQTISLGAPLSFAPAGPIAADAPDQSTAIDQSRLDQTRSRSRKQ